MAYYLDLFSPETHAAFSKSSRAVSGFRIRQRQAAEKIHPGDKLICYITRLSRWAGVLEVEAPFFEDSTPIFYEKDDPFVVRFRVHAKVWLDDLNYAMPIHEPEIWNSLSTTKDYDPAGKTWTGPFRASLNKMSEEDGKYFEQKLNVQNSSRKSSYPLTDKDQRLLMRHTIRRDDRNDVPVFVPLDEEESNDEETVATVPEKTESKRIQALIAEVGEKMGFKIWLPKSDRGRVLEHWTPQKGTLLDELPLNYNDATISTIE